jgi:hypothetical protein
VRNNRAKQLYSKTSITHANFTRRNTTCTTSGHCHMHYIIGCENCGAWCLAAVLCFVCCLVYGL